MKLDLRRLIGDLWEVLVDEVKGDDRSSARILPIWRGGRAALTPIRR
jgi:hypothetical protein